MDNQTRLATVAKADALADLLYHAGWDQVIKSKLLKMKELYTGQLVQAVLTNTPPITDGKETTREQLAGRVYGIDFVIQTIEDIFRKGDRALKDLESQGVVIDTKLH
jgi:hypothetical protein